MKKHQNVVKIVNNASRQNEEPVQANVNDCELKAQVLCMGIILLLLN
jgi:hypothetical protein